jgi:hypothetical protein
MFKTPRQLPDLASIVADLDSRRARDIADYLGVSERSVFGWLASGQCPRPAHLALFWVTRWGASIIDAETANGERFARAALVAAQTENATLRGQVAYLERLHTGAANGPMWSPVLPGPRLCASEALPFVLQRKASPPLLLHR